MCHNKRCSLRRGYRCSCKHLLTKISMIHFTQGCPRHILTHNGTVFVLNKAQLFTAQRNIKWICYPKEAPWFVGFWERLIGSVKRCIKKTTGRTCLTFAEMQTLFFEIEHILNSKPLTTLYENNND